MIALVTSVLVVVIICTVTVVVLYCRARRRRRHDSSSSTYSSSWSSTSYSRPTLPRIPRANLPLTHRAPNQYPTFNQHVWKPDRTGRPTVRSSYARASEQEGAGSAAAPPNFWGAGTVLPRKFGDVTDWRWWLFTCRLLQLHWCCASFIIAYLRHLENRFFGHNSSTD